MTSTDPKGTLPLPVSKTTLSRSAVVVSTSSSPSSSKSVNSSSQSKAFRISGVASTYFPLTGHGNFRLQVFDIYSALAGFQRNFPSALQLQLEFLVRLE